MKEYNEILLSEWQAWLGNPVTQEFFRQVKKLKEASFEAQDRQVDMASTDYTAMWTSHYKGYRAGLDELLNIKYEKGNEGEEEQDD